MRPNYIRTHFINFCFFIFVILYCILLTVILFFIIIAFWFIIFFLFLQQIEGNLIYPKVVGTSIGLPGIWVLTAVTIGGSLFGIFGMLVGVPATAAFYRILRNDMIKRGK